MKKIIQILLLLMTPTVFAQEKMTTTQGVINFEASVPLFEEINATNENVTCVLNSKNGAITCTAQIRQFHFGIALMEEHFNDNYIESNRYPKAVFKGVIEGFNWSIIGNYPKEFKLKGTLELHGKSKKINTVAILRKIDTGLEIISDFTVNTKDFNIKIPEMLSMKVAEKVNIRTFFMLNKPIYANNP
jgi:hypothetical protein